MATHARPWAIARAASLALIAATLACLPAFAPGIRARAHHGGLSSASAADQCMGCHVSEAEALAKMRASPELGEPAQAAAHDLERDPEPEPAPLVADWMIDEPRACVECHRVRVPHRAQRSTRPVELAL